MAEERPDIGSPDIGSGDAQEAEWTEGEREQLARLPREMPPSELFEDRLVEALRHEGILGPRKTRLRTLPKQWRAGVTWPAAAAAGLVLFLGGMIAGQWMSGRAMADAVAAVRGEEPTAAAMALQEIGSAYVTQLAELAEMRIGETGDPELIAQSREVGFATLFAASSELARLDPNNGELAHIIELLRPLVQSRTPQLPGSQRVVWF